MINLNYFFVNQVLKLRNFFAIGQFIPVRVIQVINSANDISIDLSTRPTVIHQEFNHGTFKKGMLLWAAVSEVLDHGYRLDIGRTDVRIFLPNKNVEEEKTYSKFVFIRISSNI